MSTPKTSEVGVGRDALDRLCAELRDVCPATGTADLAARTIEKLADECAELRAEKFRLREVLGALHNFTVPNIDGQLDTLRVDIGMRLRALAVEGLKNGG